MTALEFRLAVSALGLTPRQAWTLFEVSERTMRRWANGEMRIPGAVAILLGLAKSGKISVADMVSARPPRQSRRPVIAAESR